ncbi:hypothetical protein CPB83DRAFT_770863 [Crepidotus variabilis]|uniref:SET domain-containing protein n=1 Tax=Crepidotus variabilis TaxID=179855 RepID=A0A9P6EBN3_9AGAR|nr:hypothetical protein CPB83DRAFT_770863 [Crepidotus variabilis]
MSSTEKSYVPTHAEFVVNFAPGEYNSGLCTLKDFKAGEIMALVTGTTKNKKTYTSVQYGSGPEENFEFNSDLSYINHSCEPNVAVDISSNQPKWHLRALKNINAGEPLSFFYPSTEWDMTQPFGCTCGKPSCLGKIQGALHISKDDLLACQWINPHIMQLVNLRDARSANGQTQQ